jgi:hypothetical protein
MTPRYGRCEVGKRLIGHAPFGHWKTTTFIAALRHDGLTRALRLRANLRNCEREAMLFDHPAGDQQSGPPIFCFRFGPRSCLNGYRSGRGAPLAAGRAGQPIDAVDHETRCGLNQAYRIRLSGESWFRQINEGRPPALARKYDV